MIFENSVKILSYEKKNVFLTMARPVCRRLHFNLIKHFTENHLASKTLVFAYLTKKTKKKTFPKHN